MEQVVPRRGPDVGQGSARTTGVSLPPFPPLLFPPSGTDSRNPDWDLNPPFYTRTTHPGSGLTEVWVLRASGQKEFSETPRDRREEIC